jgi:23S rRNA (cytosine1962-C5)-methyltransferase
VALLRPAGVLERSDVEVRGKEGLKQLVEMRHGEPPPELTIHENGHAFLVDLWSGHKTGFYLDQRDNRAAAGRPVYLEGREVLNVFAYTGAFGVYAAAAGATRVVQVDSSAAALAMAERNMALNGFAADELIAGDAFEVLRYYREEGRSSTPSL